MSETTKETTINPFISIQQDVKSRLVSNNNVVREMYIQSEVTAKLNDRVALVKSAIAKVVELEKELKKTKPDQVACDADGKVVSELYSKATADKLKETKEKIAKLEAAITKAFESADYSDLEKSCK